MPQSEGQNRCRAVHETKTHTKVSRVEMEYTTWSFKRTPMLHWLTKQKKIKCLYFSMQYSITMDWKFIKTISPPRY